MDIDAMPLTSMPIACLPLPVDLIAELEAQANFPLSATGGLQIFDPAFGFRQS